MPLGRPRKTVPTANNDQPPEPDRHGFRGLPPPATFNLYTLPDEGLLTDIEVAAIIRISTNTTSAWRRRPGHPLKWIAITGGFVRYRVADVKAFLASGTPRKFPKLQSKPKPTGEPSDLKVARKPRRRADRAAVRPAADAVEQEA